jgi:DNA-binding NarL/FixJ family response regulator
MPVMNGMQAALEIRRISPRTKILFLTVLGTNEAAAGARMLADGFVMKSAAGKELIPALERLLPSFPKETPRA